MGIWQGENAGGILATIEGIDGDNADKCGWRAGK